MEKKEKVIVRFYREHPYLVFLFIVSVFFMIKNSNIPYLIFEKNEIIRFIFDKWKGVIGEEFGRILELFASTYATSLMFYYLVDYLPQCKRYDCARSTLHTYMLDLYKYMNELHEMFYFFVYEQTQLVHNEEWDEIFFNDEMVCCKIIRSDSGSVNLYNYRLVYDGNKCINTIRKKVEKICRIPSFENLTQSQKDKIAQVEDLDLIKFFPNSTKQALKGLNYKEYYEQFGEVLDVIGELIAYEGRFQFEKLDEKEELEYRNDIMEKRASAQAQGYDINNICLMLNGNKY